jgi:hypothetical protein
MVRPSGPSATKPSRVSLVSNTLTRERVVPIISASAVSGAFGRTRSGAPCLP